MTTLNRLIDHTLLKASATTQDFEVLWKQALEHHFFAVCVPLPWVKLLSDWKAQYLVETPHEAVKNLVPQICSVVDFPLGNAGTIGLIAQTQTALEAGAEEIDMVINISQYLSGNKGLVRRDIRQALEEVKAFNKKYLLKVIIETCYLNKKHIQELTETCIELNVDYIKTSTGFGTSGAQLEDVQLMKSIIDRHKSHLKIKASGGIADESFAQSLVQAGCQRIGSSRLIPSS